MFYQVFFILFWIKAFQNINLCSLQGLERVGSVYV